MEFYSQHTKLTPLLWDAYSANAFRTAPDMGPLLTQWGVIPTDSDPGLQVWDFDRFSRFVDLQHGGLGLATEWDELTNATDEANKSEVLGDLCWYLALVVRGLGLRGADVVLPPDVRAGLLPSVRAQVPEIVGDLKRLIYYGREAVRERLVWHIQETLLWVELTTAPGSMAQLLDTNSHKLLKKRYPDGFSNEAATARRDKPGESD